MTQPRARHALVALACAAAWFGATAAARAPRPRFAIGVLRRDGIVIPFATFDGKDWRGDWPPPKKHVDVPITVASVPKSWWWKLGPRTEWQAWLGAGAPRVLHVTQPDWFPAQCFRQVGLRTDYRPSRPVPPIDTQPYPKDGLAVSPPTDVEPVAIAAPGAAAPAVVEAFDRAEQSALVHTWPRVGAVALVARARMGPVKIEARYVYGEPKGRRVYYIEATRTYPDPQDAAACGAVTFGGGWFTADGAGPLTSLGFDTTIVKCDRYGLAYMLPLGVVRAGGRLFWVAQWSGWDYERYEIVEITSAKAEPVFAAWGGSC